MFKVMTIDFRALTAITLFLLALLFSLPNLLMAGPSVVIIGLGLHVAAVYLGWARLPEMEVALLWQYATLLTSILATLSVGAGLVEKYRASARQQADLIERLHRSELALEERVAQRTTELLKTQNRLQRTLDEERRAREEQRHVPLARAR